jgi:hypothetical protein
MPDSAANLFGEPALLKGENKDQYMRLLAAVEADLKPETSFDWMMVYDQTNKYSEELRLRRISTSLIEGAKAEALEILLRPHCVDMFDISDRSPSIARNYFSGDANAKKEAIKTVAYYGITPEQIEAKAMQVVIGALHVIDRMSSNRETSRRILRKEHAILRKERERQLAANDNTAARASDGSKKIEG